jgi:hypothetical protein
LHPRCCPWRRKNEPQQNRYPGTVENTQEGELLGCDVEEVDLHARYVRNSFLM